MRVFVTGATGYIGSPVVKELIDNGHQVVGLARSDAAKQRLAALGASSISGSLEGLESLKRGAEVADAVMHLAFVHNFSDFAAACNTDMQAIATIACISVLQAIVAIGEALANTNKPFIVTSGVPSSVDGHIITENDDPDMRMPRQTEAAALPFVERGVRVMIVRPSRFVYGECEGGFITQLINIARDKGVSAYVRDGTNSTHAVHVRDLARLYLLVLENGEVGAKYQGVSDFAVAYRVLLPERAAKCS